MIKQRIFGLDLMRAVAILCVVLSHSLWVAPNISGTFHDLMTVAGVIGVEIFFVLSGFLIGRIIYRLFVNNTFSFGQVMYFWIRRWFRTLPNYYLALLLNIVIALYIGTTLPTHLWEYFLFFQNLTSEMPWFFSESWSLSVEEFAYIIGPLLLYLILFFKLKISKPKLFALVTLTIILLFTLTKVIYNFNFNDKDLMFWNVNLKAVTVFRIDAIYFGVFAALISEVRPKFWKKFRFIGFVFGAIIFMGLNYIIPAKKIFIEAYPFLWNVLYLPINSIAIAFCLPLLSSFKSAPKFILKPITFISIISYSMYLLHYSIVLQLLKYFLPSDGLSNFDTLIYILVYLIITIMLSYILYYIFEKPMMDLRDSKVIKNKFKSLRQ